MTGTGTIAHERWYQLPLVWLGVAIFVASLAGCIGMIVLAARYPDQPLPASSEHLLKMPAARAQEGAPVVPPDPSQ